MEEHYEKRFSQQYFRNIINFGIWILSFLSPWIQFFWVFENKMHSLFKFHPNSLAEWLWTCLRLSIEYIIGIMHPNLVKQGMEEWISYSKRCTRKLEKFIPWNIFSFKRLQKKASPRHDFRYRNKILVAFDAVSRKLCQTINLN